MKRKLFYGFSLALLSAVASNAQQSAPGYDRMLCLKLQPGKETEFTQFENDVVRKVEQAEVDRGDLQSWQLWRTVFPAGEEARCDYMVVLSYAGAPSAPHGPEYMPGLLKSVGINMTVAEYRAKAAEEYRLVSSELLRRLILVGEIQKGDYMYLNFMKVRDIPGYSAFERDVWQPLGEGFVKEGMLHAWFVMQSFLPSGTSLPYQMITADVFPNWELAMKGENAPEMFKKVHPDMDMSEIEVKLNKMRDLDRRYFITVLDTTAPASKTAK